jgi:hypothetical protein
LFAVIVFPDTETGIAGWNVEKLYFEAATMRFVAVLVVMARAGPPEVAEMVKLVVVGTDWT